jgi:hypothetical protein
MMYNKFSDKGAHFAEWLFREQSFACTSSVTGVLSKLSSSKL